jgi:hypothetical protein
MYKTRDPNVYYHTHGSLEATPIFKVLGLPRYREDLTDYNQICATIQEQCSKFPAEELDRATEQEKQAGAIVFTEEELLDPTDSEHLIADKDQVQSNQRQTPLLHGNS